MDIKQLRLSLGLSQERFAQRLSVSLATVRRWESGEFKPSHMAMGRLEKLQQESGGKDG